MYYVYTDGASRGNGGDSAASFIIVNSNDDKVIASGSKYIGKVTNNIAEYIAVYESMKWCMENDIDDVKVISDSMLVMKQLSGEWKVKHSELRKWRNDIKRITDTFESVYFEWHPREHPMIVKCDLLNNECLDGLL